MKLIRRLPTRLSKNGKNLESWGLFKCPDIYCGKEVEKRVSSGYKCDSCGCQLYSKIVNQKKALGNTGKKRTKEQIKNMSHAHKGHIVTKETRQKIREARTGKKRKPVTEETRQKMRLAIIGLGRMGDKAPNWNGGTSFEEYGIEFNKELKQFILERDNHVCQDPNCKHLSKKLDCHHIDYDKKNNNPENLIVLCSSCHMKTNGKNKRKYFTEYYQIIIMGKIMECLL